MGAELSNATLQRIDAPGVRNGAGSLPPYAPGPAMAVRCVIDEPTFVLRRLIDDLELSSTSVLYVFLADLPTAASVLIRNGQVLVQQDGMDPVLYRIDWTKPRASDAALGHVVCLLREA